MFNLDTSPCYGELVFMERYQEAVREMARVENNIENQASDGTGGIRKSGSGRSTLQAIGNAAAAGKDHFFRVPLKKYVAQMENRRKQFGYCHNECNSCSEM